MITDNERREVAARLRANHRRDRETQGTFVARMVKGSDTVTASYVCRLPERLADLIDRPTTTRHGKFDIESNDQEVFFDDAQGKRVIIQGGIVVSEED